MNNQSRRICTFLVLSLFLTIIPHTANAEMWSKQYQVDYTLGDNDNRTDARKIAINKLRMLAAGDAGKYIQGDEVLMNDKYAKGIHIATASIVSVKDIKETMTVNNAGQSVLHLAATATVDDGVLKQRIAAIRKDAALAARLADEDARVAALFERMAELNGNLAAAKETAKMYRLMGERVRVEADIQSVFGQSRKEFAPGELKAIADRYVMEQKRAEMERERAEKRAQAEADLRAAEQKIIRESKAQKRIAWLQQHFYQPLMKNTTVDAKIEQVVPSDGGGYDITAKLYWDTHMRCPVFHLKRTKINKFVHEYPFLATVIDTGTLGVFHTLYRLSKANMPELHKDEQLKAWRNDPENLKNPLFRMGGCPDETDHISLSHAYAKTHGMSYSNDTAAQYLQHHHVVIKLALTPDHGHVKYVPVFDGGFFSKNYSNDYFHSYTQFDFHVSEDEINAIEGIEATVEVQSKAESPRISGGNATVLL